MTDAHDARTYDGQATEWCPCGEEPRHTTRVHPHPMTDWAAQDADYIASCKAYADAAAERGVELPPDLPEVDHAQCAPEAHDRSLPDDGGRPYDQPYDEHGWLSDKQAHGADGLLACNDCGEPLFYCRNTETYHHVDPEAGCFLAPAWGTAPGEHAFTHKPAGVLVTHADAGNGGPLCGWIADDETATGDWTGVTCRDCLVARP